MISGTHWGTWHIGPTDKGGLLCFEFAVQGSGKCDIVDLCQQSGGKRGSMNKAYSSPLSSDQICGLSLLLPMTLVLLWNSPSGASHGGLSRSYFTKLQPPKCPYCPKLHQDFTTLVPIPFKPYTLLSGRHYIQYTIHFCPTRKLPSKTMYACFSRVL